MPDNNGSVVITASQMYAEMREMKVELTHLSTLLDPAITEIRIVTTDHELRIRVLEKKIWAAAGLAAAVGAGAARLIAYQTGLN